MKLILTHENADFDAVASMLGAYKLYPDSIPLLPKYVNRAVDEFLTLYKSGLPFMQNKDWARRHKVEQIILTDTQSYQSIRGVKATTPIIIYDHHALERELEAHETWAGDNVGSASTLMVEKIREGNISINSLEATLLALGIYADTGMLSFGGTSARDASAVAWLIEQGAVLDTVRRFLTLPMTDEQQILFDELLQKAEHRNIQGYTITVTATRSLDYIEGISFVTHRLMDIWDSAAIFTIVEMPQKTQLVCRSRVEDIDVAQVAELFGGGGHPRASAAPVREQSLNDITSQIWAHLQYHIRPAVRVRDLMSQSIQSLNANDLLKDKLSFIRRVGHEGYPVVENGKIVGLLTRRDADRASEHQLKAMKIRDVMIEGHITLTPDDSVARLEQLMVDSGWGQIPIVNHNNEPIGIVTRTDLISYWAKKHPSKQEALPKIISEDIETILGAAVAKLIETIAHIAQNQSLTVYMVGGVVRDLMLKRPNFDIDFVVEGDAIAFTENLVNQLGGTMHSHKPFGTAKWSLDDSAANNLGFSLDILPHHIDFATARFEYYEQPTALPTVYSSSIKLDLQRRDFTINTLAVQLSPLTLMWHILDIYGGMRDLREGLLRVLHSLSFVDDPTRIIRAVRFSERLGFVIEPRTAELISTALPMLKQITGERLQNEISLLLREQTPEKAILKLQALDVMEYIHPDFQVSNHLADYFQRARTSPIEWLDTEIEITRLYWHLMMVDIEPENIVHICERLGFGRPLSLSMASASRLASNITTFMNTQPKPSDITRYLENVEDIALAIVWLISDDAQIRQIIEQFATKWRDTKAISTGNTLKEMGLLPGPNYKIILDTLRDAWLDGTIHTEHEEAKLLQDIIRQIGAHNEHE